jgi:hypothetical protein
MNSTVALGTGGEQHRVDERPPFSANAFFSASDEAVDATMHYDTGLAIEEVKIRKFEHIADPDDRAGYVAWKTKKLQTMLAASTVRTMMFEHSCKYSSDPFEERAQVTIFKHHSHRRQPLVARHTLL